MKTWLRSAGALALLALGACAEDETEPLFVIMRERELAPGATEFKPKLTGCLEITRELSGGTFSHQSAGVAGSAAPAPGVTPPIADDFRVERTEVRQGLRVTVMAGPQLLESKLYTHAFLRTQAIDVIDVMTGPGVRHQLAHRGGHDCGDSIDLFEQ